MQSYSSYQQQCHSVKNKSEGKFGGDWLTRKEVATGASSSEK